jgi:crotonobetainyl-CoA:carnitine CoA-transferase CaiB-like acyl-CoA transferase
VIDRSMNHREADRCGNRDPRYVPHDVYRCRGEDDWIALSAESDGEWSSLARALGLPEDPRLATAAGRRAHRDLVGQMISAAVRNREVRDLAQSLAQGGLRAAEVMNTEELSRDPHFLARELTVALDHSVLGAKPILGLPIRGLRYRYQPAPLLGADNEAILNGWLGLSSDEIRQLAGDRVVF